MPELAEVEFFRKRWSLGHGAKVLTLRLHEDKKVFRNGQLALLKKSLIGAQMVDSETAAKQMLFRFKGGGLPKNSLGWLGIHLGMSGELRTEPLSYTPTKHDHCVLVQATRQLVFNDPRMFGGIRFATGHQPPTWWTRIAPPILSKAFTIEEVRTFLRRRSRTSIKAVLLMQEKFPGIGNWMADEVLWRAAIHPKKLAGALTSAEVGVLHRVCQQVCRLALQTIAGRGTYLPPNLNHHIPKSWLFWHRWADGGRCPRTHKMLVREQVGGRTTCWSPVRQRLG
jgi:formamidopyrimidine-DNA glycosylase